MNDFINVEEAKEVKIKALQLRYKWISERIKKTASEGGGIVIIKKQEIFNNIYIKNNDYSITKEIFKMKYFFLQIGFTVTRTLNDLEISGW